MHSSSTRPKTVGSHFSSQRVRMASPQPVLEVTPAASPAPDASEDVDGVPIPNALHASLAQRLDWCFALRAGQEGELTTSAETVAADGGSTFCSEPEAALPQVYSLRKIQRAVPHAQRLTDSHLSTVHPPTAGLSEDAA